MNDTIGLTFSAPLSKDGDTPFATLDGLSSGTKVEFAFTRFQSRAPTQAADDANPLLVRARARCRAAVPAYAPGCVRLDDAFERRFFEPEELVEYKRDYARRSIQRSLAWSLRAAVGYDEYSFYPDLSFAKSTTERVSFSIGGGLAIFPFRRASASLNLDFQRGYDAAKAVPTCPVPAAGATSVACVPGPLAGPDRTDKLVLAPELRYLLHVSDGGLVRNLGFAPRLEADLLSSDVAIDVPIYFAADKDSGLVGGLRLGYLTEGDDFRFGVFVGKALSLFK